MSYGRFDSDTDEERAREDWLREVVQVDSPARLRRDLRSQDRAWLDGYRVGQAERQVSSPRPLYPPHHHRLVELGALGVVLDLLLHHRRRRHHPLVFTAGLLVGPPW